MKRCIKKSWLTNETPAEYFAATKNPPRGARGHVMTRSELWAFIKSCPIRWREHKQRESMSDSMVFGSLVDLLLLTPDAFKDRVAIRPDRFRPGEGAIFNNHNKDRIIAREAEVDDARAAVNSFLADEFNHQFIDGQRQVVVRGEYSADELCIPIACMIDVVPSRFSNALVDIKTTSDGAPERFKRSAFDFGYHVQAAWYIDAWNNATSEKRDTVIFVCIENVPPFATSYIAMHDDGSGTSFIDLGRALIVDGLARYADVLRNDKWHGHWRDQENRFEFIHPDPWMFKGL